MTGTRTRLCRRAALLLSASSFLPLPPLFAFDARTPPDSRSLIIVSWDGVQREHMRELLEQGRLPSLARLSASGSLVDIDVAGHQTDTKAGHAQMLTGQEPEVTGVYSNSRFRPVPSGLSLFELLQSRYGSDGVATIMLTGKSHNIGSMGPQSARAIRKEAGSLLAKPARSAKGRAQLRKSLQRLLSSGGKNGEPWHLVRNALTAWDGDLQRDASQVGPLALGYLQRFAGRRLCAFFHFSDPDHAGHSHGEDSIEYSDAIVTCDTWLGRILSALDSLGIAGRTMVFVTSDHGFDEGQTSHKDAPRVFLATDDPSVKRSGLQRDIVPTVLAEMGIGPATVSPRLPGSSLSE